MTKVFSDKSSFSSPGRSPTIAQTPLLVQTFYSPFHVLCLCHAVASFCVFFVCFLGSSECFENSDLATEILPAISKLKFLKAKE